MTSGRRLSPDCKLMLGMDNRGLLYYGKVTEYVSRLNRKTGKISNERNPLTDFTYKAATNYNFKYFRGKS